MDKIYDPIQKRFLKLNSKKGLKTLQKYIKNFNGGFIRELHPDIASGNICFPYTRVRQYSDVTDCSLIALSLIGLPLEDAVRIFNRQKNPDGLSEDEVAFYEALAENDSAVNVMGDEKLKLIAHELLKSVRSNATIDWHHSDMARAKIRVAVKRILKKYGYPPDLQSEAIQTVLQQAEAFSEKWAA